MCDGELLQVLFLSTIDECTNFSMARVILASTLFEFSANSTTIGVPVSSLAMHEIILEFAFVPSTIRPSFNAVKYAHLVRTNFSR